MKHNKELEFKEKRKKVNLKKGKRTAKNNHKATTLANKEDQWLKLWLLINLMIPVSNWILWVVGDRDQSEREGCN